MDDSKTNARFWYGDDEMGENSFGVYLTKFWYGWKVLKKGSSQARQAQTIYPFRMVQGDLNVELQFPGIGDRDDDGNGWKTYREFCNFIRSYHLLCTSGSGVMGRDIPFMKFSCSKIPPKTYDGNGMGYVPGNNGGIQGIRYAVAVPSINMTFSNDAVVQTVTLTLSILSDDSGEMSSTIESSYKSGSWGDIVAKPVARSRKSLVSRSDVSSKGSDAFIGIASTAVEVGVGALERMVGKIV